jgi:hypothetical protein
MALPDHSMINRPIRTEAEYKAALAEVDKYFDDEPRKGTTEADPFDLLVLLIEAYEEQRHPIGPAASGGDDPAPNEDGRLYESRPCRRSTVESGLANWRGDLQVCRVDHTTHRRAYDVGVGRLAGLDHEDGIHARAVAHATRRNPQCLRSART